jgi:predicted metal-binding membrane protein
MNSPNTGCAITTTMIARPREALLSPGDARIALLLAFAGAAWLFSARLATADMRQGVLTSAPPAMASSGQMGNPGSMAMSMSMGLGVFIGSWSVMMAAMMLPSLVPAVQAFGGRVSSTGGSRGATALFVASYLLVWSAVGMVAYAVVQALQAWLPAGNETALRGGAVLLFAAGLYQLTPLKGACLRQCRAPRVDTAPPAIAWASGRAIWAGFVQGLYCLGSSWPLMLVLLLLGMMNLAWMGVVAAAIFVEKVLPRGDVIGKGVGWALVGLGIVLAATPHSLPALTGLILAAYPS